MVGVKDSEYAVTKGLVLAQVDDFDAERNLAISADNLRSAELKLENARKEVLPNLGEKLNEYELNLKQATLNRDRYAELLAAGGVSKAELEKAEKEYQRALSQYNQQKLELESFSRSGRLADLEYQARSAGPRSIWPGGASRTRASSRPSTGPSSRSTSNRGGTRLGDPGYHGRRERQLGARAVRRPAGDAFPQRGPAGPGHHGRLPRCPDRGGGVLRLQRDRQGKEHLPSWRIMLKDAPPFIESGVAGRAEDHGRQVREGPGPAREVRPEGRRWKRSVWLWDGRKAALVPVSTRPVGERWVLVEGLEEGSIVLDADASTSAGKLKPGRETGAPGTP